MCVGPAHLGPASLGSARLGSASLGFEPCGYTIDDADGSGHGSDQPACKGREGHSFEGRAVGRQAACVLLGLLPQVEAHLAKVRKTYVSSESAVLTDEAHLVLVIFWGGRYSAGCRAPAVHGLKLRPKGRVDAHIGAQYGPLAVVRRQRDVHTVLFKARRTRVSSRPRPAWGLLAVQGEAQTCE